MAAKNNDWTRFISAKEFTKLMVAHAFGLLPFLRVSGHILQIPFYTRSYEEASLAKLASSPTASALDRFLTRLRFRCMRSFTSLLPSFNEHLNRRGILVFYWVLNTEVDFQAALASNPNGIITDTPTLLR